MAPELISGKQYDAKADIWSFGITAIELTQGRAPRSREDPSKVLLKTCVVSKLTTIYHFSNLILSLSVQEASPEFQRESGRHKFSRQFKEIVERCLEKNPAKRPTAAELLDTSFFRTAKRKNFLVNSILSASCCLSHFEPFSD
jgi:serine/threonine-protein kinase OSR1/STK39